MAPEKKNTHRLSLDTISAIQGMFDTSVHAHAMLKLKDIGVTVRRLNSALQHRPITHSEASAIETLWERWRDYYLKEEHAHLTDFSLPDDMTLAKSPVRYDEDPE